MTLDLSPTGKILFLLIIYSVGLCALGYFWPAQAKSILTHKLAEVPMDIKCVFNEPKCEEGDIDGFTLVTGIVFVLIGITVPDQYLIVAVWSIILELVRSWMGTGARYVIGPLVNLTGYGIGSAISRPIKRFMK